MNCGQCEMLSINGVPCHERGCPNMGARWDGERWIKQRECFECGCTVDADAECCNGEPEPAPPGWFTTSSGRIELQIDPDDARSASQPGKDATEDVDALLAMPYIAAQVKNIDPALLSAELAEYGAWDDVERGDHEENLRRLIWLASCDIREDSGHD